MDSFLDNVVFNVVDVSYNDTLLVMGTTEELLAEGVVGHLAYLGVGKEGDMTGPYHERDRSSMYRLSFRMRFNHEVSGGTFVRIVKEKDPDTNAWVVLDTPKQFKVDMLLQAFALGRETILSLSGNPAVP